MIVYGRTFNVSKILGGGVYSNSLYAINSNTHSLNYSLNILKPLKNPFPNLFPPIIYFKQHYPHKQSLLLLTHDLLLRPIHPFPTFAQQKPLEMLIIPMEMKHNPLTLPTPSKQLVKPPILLLLQINPMDTIRNPKIPNLLMPQNPLLKYSRLPLIQSAILYVH